MLSNSRIVSTADKFSMARRTHYKTQYSKILDLASIKDKKIREYLISAWFPQASHYGRLVNNTQRLKYIYPFSKTNNIVSCFKFTLNAGTGSGIGTSPITAIYGYLYSRFINGNIEHLYVCTGPTFTSQDGEYRGRMIPWAQFARIFTENAALYSRVEEAIVRRLESAQMTYHVDFYVPDNIDAIPDVQLKLDKFVNEQRLAVKYHILCWIVDMHEIHTNSQPNHINPAYSKIIYQHDDIDLLTTIIAEVGIKKYIVLKNQITWLDLGLPHKDILKDISCGQKLFPVTSSEMTRINDINYPIWREIYATTMAGNMVLNLISPTFPVIGTWFYVANTDASIFDNEAMHLKYQHSEVAQEIDDGLRTVDSLNYDKETRNILSNKFLRLSKSVHATIQYANENIKIVDTSICMTMAYAGRTLRDTPKLIAGREITHGSEQIFSSKDVFAKHMFEYMYGIVCMNTKMNTIHSDLHLNNVTMFRLHNFLHWPAQTSRGGINYQDNFYVVYALTDRSYIFPHFGVFSTIIDFSRAVLGGKQQIEHEFGILYTELFLSEQTARFMVAIRKNLPWLVEKYEDGIIKLLNDNFLLAFKILTAMDAYTLMYGLRAMLETEPLFKSTGGTPAKVALAPEAIPLVNKLASAAKNLLLRNFQNAINGTITHPDDIEWPNMEILLANFNDYILGDSQMNDSNVVVCDIFNYNNEVNNSFIDPQLWGPLVDASGEVELRKQYGIGADPIVTHMYTFKNFDEATELSQLQEKYSISDDSILHIEDWMIT